MNYLKQINAFYDRLDTDPLNSSEIALWHALMAINNKTAWSATFTVASSVLMHKSGISSDTTFYRTRNGLAQAGYITWESRKGNQAAIYSVIDLSPIMVDSPGGSVVDTSVDGSGGSSGALNKLNKTKQNDDDDAGRQKVYQLWQDLWGFPNAIAVTDIDHWITDVGPELLCFAIEIAGRHNVSVSGADKYIERVVDGWQKMQITTLEAARKANETHEQRISNSQRQRGGHSHIKETLPDWVQDDYVPPKKPEAERDNLPSFDEILRGD